MSKRHQSSRRKSYGRRQHELRERADRTDQSNRVELPWDDGSADAAAGDPFGFLDRGTPRLRFALGD